MLGHFYKNKDTYTHLVIGVVLVIGTFFLVFGNVAQKLHSNYQDSPATEVVTHMQDIPQTVSSYTLYDVSSHDSAESCWSAVNGNVYDLTNWIGSHPGGKAAILMLCGKDGSALFNRQHGHAEVANRVLEGFKIGQLL